MKKILLATLMVCALGWLNGRAQTDTEIEVAGWSTVSFTNGTEVAEFPKTVPGHIYAKNGEVYLELGEDEEDENGDLYAFYSLNFKGADASNPQVMVFEGEACNLLGENDEVILNLMVDEQGKTIMVIAAFPDAIVGYKGINLTENSVSNLKKLGEALADDTSTVPVVERLKKLM